MSKPQTPPVTPAEQPRRVPSEELLRGERLLVIEHAGQSYRLLVTRSNKLILQK